MVLAGFAFSLTTVRTSYFTTYSVHVVVNIIRVSCRVPKANDNEACKGWKCYTYPNKLLSSIRQEKIQSSCKNPSV